MRVVVAAAEAEVGPTAAEAGGDQATRACEVAVPELVASLCTLLVLAPLALMPGLGEFLYRPMAAGVAFAMISAYLLSRTFVPSRSARWLKANAARWNGNVAKLGVYGSSSGGHVAELLAMKPGDPRYASIPLTGGSDVDASVAYVATRSPVSNTFARYENAERRRNEAMMKTADVLDYLVEDEATRVICLFLEEIGDPARFARVAEKADRAGKPIVALKVGSSPAGQQAALAHTGSVAGDDAVVDAVLRQLNVIRVTSLEELLTTGAALGYNRWPRGRQRCRAADL